MIRLMLDMRFQQHFIDSADLQYQLGEGLAPALESAVQAMLASVTGGGRLLVGGLGASMALAQYLVTLLVAGFERERPGLPAMALLSDALLATAAHTQTMAARQVQSLGQSGDALLLISADKDDVTWLPAIEAAHANDMTVVALAVAGAAWTKHLRETDVLVAVPHDRLSRVREVQLLALHCLCDGIDAQLLGEQE